MSKNESLLRGRGLKVSLPRLKVMQAFEAAPHQHLTADDVHRRLSTNGDSVGIATVYRILVQLAEVGFLRKSSFDQEKAVFELELGLHHDHLVCVYCGKVVEFFDPVIEEQQNIIANEHKFQLLEHTMSLYGVCETASCRVKAQGMKKHDNEQPIALKTKDFL